MANKKYYWLKLQKDFFKRHDIRIVETMPNGKDYILFYLKLLLESVTHDGHLRFSDTIPYSEEMLATITNTNIDVVRAAMGVFRQLNMIEILDDETIFLSEVTNMTGCETSVAERVRKHRENQKALQCNEVKQNCNIEIELEIEKEIDIDLKDNRAKSKRFVPPTLEEVKAYCKERNNKVDAERFVDFYEGKGWMVGKNKMKDWKACVRTWEKDDKGNNQQSKPSTNKFNNYPQRTYTEEDYREQERKLFNKGL